MARTRPKRKQPDEETPNFRARKKYKETETSSPNPEADDGSFFSAEEILQERPKKYLISWKGLDPATGDSWQPTWEPKSYANKVLVSDWLERKEKKRRGGRLTTAGPSTTTSARGKRRSTVREIASSPPPAPEPYLESRQIPETALTQSQPTPDPTPDRLEELTRDKPEAQSASPLSEPPAHNDHRRKSQQAIVEISERSDFEPGQYEQFSQPFLASQTSLVETPESSKVDGRRNPAVKVVPDSQSLPGASSYHPSAQSAPLPNGTGTENSSSTTEEQRSPSSVDEITQFVKKTHPHVVEESDPITDPSSPPQAPLESQRQDSPAEGNFAEVAVSSEQSEKKTSESVQNSVHSNKTSADSQHSKESTDHVVVTASSGLDKASGNTLEGSDNSSRVHQSSDKHSEQNQSSVAARDFAEDNITGHFVAQSIEFSPPPQDRESTQPTTSIRAPHTVDQADVSTQGEYSGPREPEQSAHINSSGKNPARGDPRDHNHLFAQSTPNCDPRVDVSFHRKTHDTGSQTPSRITIKLRNTARGDLSSPPRRPLNFEPHTPPPRAMEGDRTGSDGKEVPPRSLSLADKIRGMRARHAAERAADRGESPAGAHGTRSPSAIPDKRPQRTRPEQPSSLSKAADFGPEFHPPTETIELSNPPFGDPGPIVDTQEASLEIEEVEPFPHLGPEEHVIALPLRESARDQYRMILKKNGERLEEFCAKSWSSDDPLVFDMQSLADQLQNYATHPDLDSLDTLTQPNVAPEIMVNWDIGQSAKFHFLGELLEMLRDRSLHIAVICQPGRLMDILETFLQGKRIQYIRCDNERKSQEASSMVAVTLLPSSGENSRAVVASADCIIGFDNSFDAQSPNTKAVREHMMNPGQLAPVVSLFVVNTVEHVERCVPSNFEGVERLQQIMDKTTKLRTHAGKFRTEYPKPDEAARTVVEYLVEKSVNQTIPWPVPQPDIIEGFEPLSQISQSSMLEDLKRDEQHGQKRPLVRVRANGYCERDTDDNQADAMDVDTHKRTRLSALPESSSTADASLTRIRDSIPARTQPNAHEPLQNAMKPEDPRSPPNEAPVAASTGPKPHVASSDVIDIQRRLGEMTKAMEGLQFRFEDQSTELRLALRERDAAVRKAEIYEKQLETRDKTIMTLKDERVESRKQLTAQSALLKASEIPEIAENERLRIELNAEREAKEKAERMQKSQQNQFEYMTEQYQKASTSAAELGAENTAQKAKIVELAKKASGEALKHKQVVMKDREKAWQDEVFRSNAKVRDLESLVFRLHEQIRGLQNTRGVGTRANSMPRSPRLGPVSRVGSPAPAGLGIGGSKLRGDIGRPS